MVAIHKKYKENNPITETDTVIIVPSYDGQLLFLKYALQTYKETGKYVICAYDRHSKTPYDDVLDIPNAWVWKHKTWGSNKRNGWLWDIIYSSGIVESFFNIKHIVIANGDCVWENPNNIDKLIKLLGNDDILSASCDSNLIHTCNILFTRSCFISFIEEVKEKLKNNIPESYSPEVLLRDFMKENDRFINVPVSKQPLYPEGHRYEGKIDHYSSYGQNSTFEEIVGYRNIGAEHKHACLEHLEPVDKKYLDLRNNGEFLSKHEMETLYKYYTTNDRRWLYKYFAEGESSDFNRRYYDIKYYGSKKLLNDDKRRKFGPPSERSGNFDRFKCDSYILKDDKYHNGLKEEIIRRGYGENSNE